MSTFAVQAKLQKKKQFYGSSV